MLISPSLNDWIALVAFNVTVVGLSSLAEKRTVIGIEYGKYLLDKYKLFGFLRVYHLLVAVALVNAAALFVMFFGSGRPFLSSLVFFLLIMSSCFVLYYLFAYVLRVHPSVKKSIYRKQLLGLYIDSDTKCDFEGDIVIGMPPGDRTQKKITSDVQSFFNRFDEETISAFHEVFGPSSPIYSRDSKTMREWKRLGDNKPHDYRVHRRDADKTPTEVLHISWEFFQMFRFSEIQDRWLLEILNIFNGSYADKYPRLRLYNVAAIFGQINRVGFAEGLYRYKFLDYMMPFIVRALDPSGDENREERIPVERYFHVQFGRYIHDTMRNHPAATFTQSARKALSALICVEKFRGVLSVKERIPCYKIEDEVEEYDLLLSEVIAAWEKEVTTIKNLVFDFGNTLVGWDPDNLYGREGERCFSSKSRYRKFRRDVLTTQWLRELDSEVDMHEIVEKRCLEYPLYRKALKLYEEEWMQTLSGEIEGMSELISDLPDDLNILGLSNWCASTYKIAREKYPILRFENYLISGGLKDENQNPVPSKPDPLIFKEFFKRFNVAPEECFFIDDNYDNVKAARLLGMKSLWFIDAETLRLALDPVISRTIKWGENRAVWMAPDIQSGLDPQNVVITDFDLSSFSFGEDELKDDFVRYEHSDYARLMDSQQKCMLSRYECNPDDANPVLSLKLKTTEWKYCQFVWHHRYDGQDNAEKKQKKWVDRMVFEHLSDTQKSIRYPNSFCLHLVIETAEGNVLATKISQEKRNDYPETKAVTIGEQLEQCDFYDDGKLKENFVQTWIQRAVNEEFGVTDLNFDTLFDASSIRVLSLSLEEDIFNFALVCTIKMRVDSDKFAEAIKLDHSELDSIYEIPLQSVPGILLGYPYNQDEYHPSSYMRLLSFYLYKNGLKQTREVLCNRI